MPEQNLSAIIEAGKTVGEPKRVEQHNEFAVVAAGDRVESLERFMPTPARIRSRFDADDVTSFVAYFNNWNDSETAVIFANQKSTTLHAVLDYHDVDPSWCTHTVNYVAPLSIEWQTWAAMDGKGMPQVDFAHFIENNVKDIHRPTGADMLEMARNFQAKKDVNFSSAIRLQSGAQQLTFHETVAGTSAKGTFAVPEEFFLGVPVFVNGEPYEVCAKLRYRISDNGKLTLWYNLHRPELILRSAFSAIVERVEAETETNVLYGRHSAVEK